MWETVLTVQHASRHQRTTCRSWLLLCRYHDASLGHQAWWQVPLTLNHFTGSALLPKSQDVFLLNGFSNTSAFFSWALAYIYPILTVHWLVQCLMCTSNICIFAISPKGLLISPYYHKSEVRIISFSGKWNHMSTFSSPLWNTVLWWQKKPLL